jgi:membrane protease YdiL (CAAX protease family)
LSPAVRQKVPSAGVGLALPEIRRLTGSIAASTDLTIGRMTSTLQSSVPVETDIPQYSKARVLCIWAAAALPMGALAWVVAPAIAGEHGSLIPILLVCLTAGLIWQFVLVLLLNGFSLRKLWLQRPSTSDGRRGGRLWLWVLPFVLGFGALQFVPFHLPMVASHDFGAFLAAEEGRTLLHGNWGWYALLLVMMTFNTVLGEELLFRGLLLPRMRAAFGRADWVANGFLMGAYHLHQPWSIPTSIVAGLLMAYPTKRWKSAWMGIIVHSAQSVVLAAVTLALVLT